MKKCGRLLVPTIMMGLFLGGCSSKKEAASTAAAPEPAPPVFVPKPLIKGGEEAHTVLKATAFKMSGDYASNVAVTLDDTGRLTYYPDPADITPSSSPVPLKEGWYLNRQGLGPGSVFTSYTFDEYMNLPAPPSHAELLEAVIPGAVVTDFIELPVAASEASANPSECLKFLK